MKMKEKYERIAKAKAEKSRAIKQALLLVSMSVAGLAVLWWVVL